MNHQLLLTSVIQLGADIVFALCLFLALRRHVHRVAAGEHDDLPSRLDRIRNSSRTSVSVVTAVTSGSAAAAYFFLSRQGSGATRVVIPVVVAFVGLVVASSLVRLATLPTVRRLRGLTEKPPGRLRRRIYQTGMLGVVALAAWLIFAKATPSHGVGRLAIQLVMFGTIVNILPRLAAPLTPYLMVTTPLSPPVESRLLGIAERNGVTLRAIRAYPGRRQKTANAFFVGVLRFRYILVSDYLVEQLSPEEVDAVVMHEIGHARHHSALVKFMTSLVGLVLLIVAFLLGMKSHVDVLALALPWAVVLAMSFVQGAVAVYEEELADDYAAQRIGPSVLAQALAHLAELNETRDAPSRLREVTRTRHPGLARRLDRLQPRTRAVPASMDDW